MIPTRLQLRGFLSYREQVDLDLTGIEIACLAGDNGSGKSALLDAITWALWAKARASDRDVVTLGEQEMEVTFCFLLNGREYRVMRRRSYLRGPASGTHTLDLMVREAGEGDDDWREASGDTTADSQRRIDSLLNLDYGTFVRSVFVMQGQADLFMQETPAKRKELLAEILNLAEYDALKATSDRQLRELRSTLDQHRGREATLVQQLERRPQLETDLDEAAARLTVVGAQADSARAVQQQLSQQAQTWRAARDLLLSLQRREAADQTALEKITTDLQRQHTERAQLAAVLDRADAIRAGVAALNDARTEATRQAQLARRMSDLVVEKNRLTQVITDAKRALERERDQQQNQLERVTEHLAQLERDAQEYDSGLAEAQRLQTVLAGFPDHDALEAAAQATLQDLQGELGALKQRAEDFKVNLQRVEQGDDRCPVCRTPMSVEDRERIVAAWQRDTDTLRGTYRQHTLRIKELEAERTHHRTQRQERDRQAHALQTLTQRLDVLAAQRARQSELQARMEATTQTVRELDARMAARDDAPQERLAMREVVEQQAVLGYTAAAHDAADEAVQRLLVHENEYHALTSAEATLTGLLSAIEMLDAQQQEREATLSDLRLQIATITPQIVQGQDLDLRLRQASDEVDRLDGERTRCDQHFGAVERELATLDAFDTELRTLRKDLDRIQVDESALKELSLAFGRNGIQATIIDSILPELADETNQLLRRFAGSNLSVSFLSQRQMVSREGMSETLDIVVNDEAGARDLRLFSGGEAFRVNFAIRVALSRLLARRAGASIELLVIDEGFGTQDSAGRDGLIEALNSVREDFRTILVITHIHELRELFPTRIEVVKTESGSHVSIVNEGLVLR